MDQLELEIIEARKKEKGEKFYYSLPQLFQVQVDPSFLLVLSCWYYLQKIRFKLIVEQFWSIKIYQIMLEELPKNGTPSHGVAEILSWLYHIVWHFQFHILGWDVFQTPLRKIPKIRDFRVKLVFVCRILLEYFLGASYHCLLNVWIVVCSLTFSRKVLRQSQKVKLQDFFPNTCLLASVHLTSIFGWHRALGCQARPELQASQDCTYQLQQELFNHMVHHNRSKGTNFFEIFTQLMSEGHCHSKLLL